MHILADNLSRNSCILGTYYGVLHEILEDLERVRGGEKVIIRAQERKEENRADSQGNVSHYQKLMSRIFFCRTLISN